MTPKTPRAIILFEEHGATLEHWMREGLCEATVISFDRHFDVKLIGSQGIRRLLECRAAADSVRLLRRDVPFRDDDRFVFGSDSFVFAAIVLGMIKRFIWVVPNRSRKSVHYLARELWDQLSLIPHYGNEVSESFAVGPWSASCSLHGATVEVTDLFRLPLLRDLDGSTVDLDLDFFVSPNGKVDHSVLDVFDTLQQAKLAPSLDTMSFSQSSGFLPVEWRGLAHSVSAAFGRPIYYAADPPYAANRALGLLARNDRISASALQQTWDAELSSLGGPGWALRSVLESRIGLIERSIGSYDMAIALGDKGSWPAYSIGLYYLSNRMHSAAVPWFERSMASCVDSIHAHSSILITLCLCRCLRYEEALAQAKNSAMAISMRPETFSLGLIAAQQLNIPSVAREFLTQKQRVEKRWKAWT